MVPGVTDGLFRTLLAGLARTSKAGFTRDPGVNRWGTRVSSANGGGESGSVPGGETEIALVPLFYLNGGGHVTAGRGEDLVTLPGVQRGSLRSPQLRGLVGEAVHCKSR